MEKNNKRISTKKTTKSKKEKITSEPKKTLFEIYIGEIQDEQKRLKAESEIENLAMDFLFTDDLNYEMFKNKAEELKQKYQK